MVGAAHSSPFASAAEISAGIVIADRYRLDRPIATGGMATIWEATHLALKRSIALKFITIHGASPAKVRDRFLREARVAAAVRHRNVVDILDFGTSEDGRPFMAMELLVGQTLAARMNEDDPLSAGEAVRIVAQVLSGLAAVHAVGIVHRDLKPENVFLSEEPDGVVPKLLDFGVSRALDPTRELESVLPTIDNLIVGTPQYMSPEQARALPTIDQRSDLWGSGVLLFELLTGTLPFDADAIGDVIVQVATKEPPDLALVCPDLAGPLSDVVSRAMQRNPANRFQSAHEMRAALLVAVADTARALLHRAPDVRTFTDTIPYAGELLDAVGAAYEPGDSGLLRIEPSEPRPPRAPAPETIPEAGAAPPSAAPPSPAPRRRRRLPLAFALTTAAIVGGLVATAVTARPPLPQRSAPAVNVEPPREVVAEEVEPPVITAAPEMVCPPPVEEAPHRPAISRPSPARSLMRDPGF